MILADDGEVMDRASVLAPAQPQDIPTVRAAAPPPRPTADVTLDPTAPNTDEIGGAAIEAEISRLSREAARPGALSGMAASFGANREAAREVDNFNADDVTLARAYGPVLEAINKGRSADDLLGNPYSPSEMGNFSDLTPLQAPGAVEDQIWARVEQLRKINPQAAANIPANKAELMADVLAEQRTALDYGDLLSSQSHINAIAGFAGRMAGSLEDPPNILAAALGGPGASTVLSAALREGALNTALDLADIPGRLQRYKKLGVEISGGDVMAELGADFVLGGIFGAGAHAMLHSPVPEVRTAAQIIDDQVSRTAENPHAGDSAGQDLMRRGALSAMNALQDGRLDLMPDTSGQLGRALDPKIEAARRRQGFTVESFAPEQLTTDAGQMQYKGGGDAAGVTDRLQGVTQWDPAKAGISLVWEKNDGALVIADGHQRLGLAKRLAAEGQEGINLYGMRYREVDGFAAQDMRVIAALKNIAEGTGSGIDAARVLRESPHGLKELPPRSSLVRQAHDLAALSHDAFGMAINGHASERDAALVGRHVKDPALQAPILAHLAKNSPDTAEEAEILVRQALAAGAHQELQSDMFGSFLKADLILPQRVKILKAAMTALRKDKALFSTLTERQSAIEAAGNKLNVSENAARSETAARAFAMLKALAERKGPISDALQRAAQGASESGNRRAAVAQFLQDVRGAVERGELDSEFAGDTGRDLETEAAHLGLSSPAPTAAHADLKRLQEFSDPITKPAAFERQAETLALDLAPAPPQQPVHPANFLESQKGRELADLYKDAPKRQAELDSIGAAIAKDTGTEWKTGGVKDRATAEAKIGRKGYGDAGRITDITRGLFLVNDAGAAEDIVHQLAQHFDVLDEGWSILDTGYFDRKLLVRFAGGEIGEVQMRTPAMHEAVKSGGHKAFKIRRDPARSQDERAAALAKERELYSAALADAPESFRGSLSQDGKAGSSPKVLVKTSSDISRAEPETSNASTSDQPLPRSSTAAARNVDLLRTDGRSSQEPNTSMGNTSDLKVGTNSGENKPEFGDAQPQIEAVRRIPQDVVLADPLSDGETTVRAARRRMEREARAVEALRGCMEGANGV